MWRLGYGLDGPGFEYRKGQDFIFFFFKISRPHLPYSMGTGIFPRGKQLGREVNNLLSFGVEVNNECSCISVFRICFCSVDSENVLRHFNLNNIVTPLCSESCPLVL